MKHNWEYKKLGDVCDYPNRRIAIKDLCVGEYVGVENLVKNKGGLVRSTEMPDADNSIEFHIGDVLIGNIRPYLRKIWLADFNGGASGDVIVVRVKKDFENKLLPSYLYKVLSSEKFFEYDNSNTKGAKMPRGDRKIIAKYAIPVPPLSEQSRNVAELDLLTGIIDKQNAQLKELDNLAQAIFYDMFGDPIENPKGWEVKKLGELCDVYRGGSPRPINEYLGGTIPWIKIGDATQGDDIYLHQTKEHIIEKGLSKTRYIHSGSLIFANCGVSLGFARIITFDGCIHDGWLAFDNISNEVEKVFLLKSLNFCTQHFRDTAPDGTQPNLNTSIMKNFDQIVPPLHLQKIFINKIQSIEKQKSAIKASIADTQKLLDYTMDKYFG